MRLVASRARACAEPGHGLIGSTAINAPETERIGALLVRTSLTCRRTWVEGDEDDGCGDGTCGDGCAQFNEPRPAFDVDDQWGCVRTSRSGQKSLADADDCPTTAYAPDNGFQVNNEEKPTIAEARLHWLVRGGDVVLLHDFGEVEAW
jgi:hypothetical protein